MENLSLVAVVLVVTVLTTTINSIFKFSPEWKDHEAPLSLDNSPHLLSYFKKLYEKTISFWVRQTSHLYVILSKLFNLPKSEFLLRKGKTSPPFLWLPYGLVNYAIADTVSLFNNGGAVDAVEHWPGVPSRLYSLSRLLRQPLTAHCRVFLRRLLSTEERHRTQSHAPYMGSFYPVTYQSGGKRPSPLVPV